MKIIIISVFLWISLFADMGKKWESNKYCEGCHTDISKRWETSRHANSHFSKNNLYKKTLEYIALKIPSKTLYEIKVDCAKCHNPRISKKKQSKGDRLSLALEHTETINEYHDALNTKYMKNGINCIVCHNIDKIHLDKDVGSRGLHTVTFGPEGTMFGPFDNANSPYHKTQKRPHFIGDNPQLCFACHYSTKNYQKLSVYATGKEYDTFSKDNNESIEGCKSCHMSKKRKGFASNYAKVGEKPKERLVREHRFASIDNSNILNDYIKVTSSTKKGKLLIAVKNTTPHKIPTGYGLREIILTAKFFDKNDKKVGEENYVLGVKWVDESKKYTIPHLAQLMVEDTRLDGKSSKTYSFKIPNNALYAKYTFSYRFINKDIAKIIGVSDKFFLKEYIFSETRVHL